MNKTMTVISVVLLSVISSVFAEDWPMFRKDYVHSAKSFESIRPP